MTLFPLHPAEYFEIPIVIGQYRGFILSSNKDSTIMPSLRRILTSDQYMGQRVIVGCILVNLYNISYVWHRQQATYFLFLSKQFCNIVSKGVWINLWFFRTFIYLCYPLDSLFDYFCVFTSMLKPQIRSRSSYLFVDWTDYCDYITTFYKWNST